MEHYQTPSHSTEPVDGTQHDESDAVLVVPLSRRQGTEPSPPPAEPKVEDREFRAEKAHADFRFVADWLAQRTLTEKLCLWAGIVLLNGDTEQALKDAGTYDGNVGQDLYSTWGGEVCELLNHPAADSGVDLQARTVLGYLAGLQTASA